VQVPAAIKNEAPVSSAPMTSFVDAGDDRCGATVIAKGLMEYEVLPDGTIAVTLIRAVGDLSRNDLATRPSGHAGPPVATPAAQCLGRHRFDMAFEPRAAAPAAADLVATARSHNIQPRVVIAQRPDATGPTTRSFLRVTGFAGLALSALKQAEDRSSVVVRVFNPGDDRVDTVLALDAPTTVAFTLNLLEERQEKIATAPAGAVAIAVGPRQIRTIELAP
jgi:alpha-mannosidase